MIKTKTVETVEEYDDDGKLVRRTVTETEETDDNPTKYVHTTSPYMPYTGWNVPFKYEPKITCDNCDTSSN